jgi:four helix bundle protein
MRELEIARRGALKTVKNEANQLLEARTLKFAVSVVHFVSRFPRSDAGSVIGRQLLKSGTSIGANYREANRAESREDFIHKTAVVLKEAAETLYWVELCENTGIGETTRMEELKSESSELLAIFTTINRRAKGR